jgi:hypothetical protein
LQESTHVPLGQVGESLAEPQTLPHVPQFEIVSRLVWQPLFALPLQTAQPALHTGEQWPAEHEVVPLGFVHAVPQAPQLVVLVLRLT